MGYPFVFVYDLIVMSRQDNDYSLVDSLIFIDSQDYRYRTINRCINCSHTDESHMDVVANITLVVESEKMGYFGLRSSVTIVKIIFLSTDNLGRVDYTAPVYLFVTGIVALDTHSSLLRVEEIVLAFFCD